MVRNFWEIKTGTHLAVCYQGEYKNRCKFNDPNCPSSYRKDDSLELSGELDEAHAAETVTNFLLEEFTKG
jgi:hypothetical protein